MLKEMGKIQKLVSSFASSLTALLLMVNPVFAAEEINLCPTEGIGKTLCQLKISQVLPAVIKLILILAILIAFFFLIIGGIKWITAGSNKEAAAEARGTLTAAIVGLVIIFLAWMVLTFLGTFFGIGDLLKFEIPVIK